MERWWYLARAGHVYGPIPDSYLWPSAAAGQVYPTDQLALVGQPVWWPASSIPGLFPHAWQPAPVPAAVPYPTGPVNAFAGLESPEEFHARMSRQAEAAANDPAANVFESLADGAASVDPRSAADAARAVRTIADALGDWFGDE